MGLKKCSDSVLRTVSPKEKWLVYPELDPLTLANVKLIIDCYEKLIGILYYFSVMYVLSLETRGLKLGFFPRFGLSLSPRED